MLAASTPDAPSRVGHQDAASAGMEGPFRCGNPQAIGALSIRSIPSRVENQMPGRQFAAPWSSEEHSAYYVVRDGNGQALAYIYYDNAAGRPLRLYLAANNPAGPPGGH